MQARVLTGDELDCFVWGIRIQKALDHIGNRHLYTQTDYNMIKLVILPADRIITACHGADMFRDMWHYLIENEEMLRGIEE